MLWAPLSWPPLILITSRRPLTKYLHWKDMTSMCKFWEDTNSP
jgi:hypothetical protein